MVALSLPGARRLEEPLGGRRLDVLLADLGLNPVQLDRDPRRSGSSPDDAPLDDADSLGCTRSSTADDPPDLRGLAEPAVYLDRAAGEHLCADHLTARIEATFRATLRGPGGLSGGERVAVAFSGGKDSSVLLHLLASLAAPELGLALVAVTVDEGIAGYRDETIAWARTLADRLGVEHRVIGFEEACGSDLDILVRGREGRACTICGVLRRRLLQQAAHELGAERLATGHCLDDEAESVVMNWLRGDLYRVAGARPTGGESMVPRTKPLARLPEKEVVSHARSSTTSPPSPSAPCAPRAPAPVSAAWSTAPSASRRERSPASSRARPGSKARLRGRRRPASRPAPTAASPSSARPCRACALLGGALEKH